MFRSWTKPAWPTLSILIWIVLGADLKNQDWDMTKRALDELGLELVTTNMTLNMLVVEKAK